MGTQFVGEIRPFAGNFAPFGWAFCNGQIIAISSNDVLYSLIGTTYGGDGVTTFGLPDLQGRVAIHQGQGNGLTNRVLGQKAGNFQVTLTSTQVPSHIHTLNATTAAATNPLPATTMLPAKPTATNATLYTTQGATPTIDQMQARAVGAVGGNAPHDNMMPSLAISYIIALQGVYPSQN